MKLQTKAFTLVELIVVVTILAVLSTIGFVSYSGYLSGVRDSNRISQIKSISEGLHLYSTNHSLPSPESDTKVDIESNSKVIAYQGYAGKNVLETITYSTEGVDPKDKQYFSYYLTRDRKYFQLMAFLEEEENLQNQAGAVDYSSRYPTVFGAKLGILTGTGTDLNIPIQEIATIQSAGSLDISLTTDNYIAHVTDINKMTGTGSSLLNIELLVNAGGNISKLKNCKEILDTGMSIGNGIYSINPEGTELFQVYCDMTSDGGGWTLLYHQDGTKDDWLFSNKTEAGNYNQDNPSINVNKYSILNKMSYFDRNGVFEFRLYYPVEDSRNIWKQTLNPFTTGYEVEGNNVPGYEKVSIEFNSSYWGGISKSDNDETLIDGSIKTLWWYNSIGNVSDNFVGDTGDYGEDNEDFPGCGQDDFYTDTPNLQCGPRATTQNRLFVR